MRKINLNKSKSIIVVKPVSVDADVITIGSIVDDGSSVHANVIISEHCMNLMLWSGMDYINIGQWTDEQAENKIKELLNVN